MPEQAEREPGACPRCGSKGPHAVVGATPSGTLLHCTAKTSDIPGRKICATEWIEQTPEATAAAAERRAAVEAAGAERVAHIPVGPLGTGPVQRLRHPQMAEAFTAAAQYSDGTVEGVLVWLRLNGFELVRAARVRCSCMADTNTSAKIRNPACHIHGDADYARPAVPPVAKPSDEGYAEPEPPCVCPDDRECLGEGCGWCMDISGQTVATACPATGLGQFVEGGRWQALEGTDLDVRMHTAEAVSLSYRLHRAVTDG